MKLSVILTTSPGREQSLAGCLSLLEQQLYPPDQVIVVDDGSQQGEAMAAASGLKPDYLWRPNDCRVAVSRNLGAEAARHELLVFLDSDMLLNPLGLRAYQAYFESDPDHALYGYFGYAPEYSALSHLLPERRVLWCDRRFETYAPEGLIPASNMLRYPHEWAWSGNFALRRERYFSVGGFDPRYQGWGGEDLDFASRLIINTPIHFFLDAWAEQQEHPRSERFHTLPDSQKEIVYHSHYDEPAYKPQVLYSPEGWRSLKIAIAHYLSQDSSQG